MRIMAAQRRLSNSDIASGVEDLKAAIEVVQSKTGVSKVHMFGESSGAIRAGAFAQMAPERVDRLILTAFTYKGNGAAEIERRRERIAELRANPRRKRDAAMIRSIFTRDGHPSLYDPAMVDALMASELQFGDSVPSGTYVDMAANLPLVDPAKVSLSSSAGYRTATANMSSCRTRRTAKRSARIASCCGMR
jgi:alpha-beta hydrolase superfamily lysophospholipase